MTFGETLFLILFAWNIIGSTIWVASHSSRYSVIERELVNPLFNKKNYAVNWFGAIMISLFFNLICPVASLIYWFWKLCTVGA